jgi:hypothetical protein
MSVKDKSTVELERDLNGVHWFWWVFWLLIFWPALIVTWIIHSNKKERARDELRQRENIGN